jgi:hypothetical protein
MTRSACCRVRLAEASEGGKAGSSKRCLVDRRLGVVTGSGTLRIIQCANGIRASPARLPRVDVNPSTTKTRPRSSRASPDHELCFYRGIATVTRGGRLMFA